MMYINFIEKRKVMSSNMEFKLESEMYRFHHKGSFILRKNILKSHQNFKMEILPFNSEVLVAFHYL